MEKLIKTVLLSLTLLISISLIGCTEDVAFDPTSSTNGEEVTFNFVVDDLNLATEDSGSSTKSSSDDDASIDIKNMWVVQYNVYDTFISAKYYETFTTTGCISISSGMSSIVFIANTFDSELIDDSITLDDLKVLTSKVSTLDDAIGIDGSSKYFILNGSITGYDSSKGATVTLKRNVAKVNLTITDDGLDTDDQYTLESIIVYNVPGKSYLYTNYDSDDQDDEYYDYEDEYTDETIVATSPINYTLTADELTSALDGGVNLYLPINEQGVVEDNIDSKDKVSNAPEYATFVKVSYRDGNTVRSFTFYLGADMIDDYNLSANNAYYYTFNINGEGNEFTDPRVEVVTYYQVANASDIATWRTNNTDIANYLITDYFDFEYSDYEVFGTNFRSTQEAIDNVECDETGFPIQDYPEYGIDLTYKDELVGEVNYADCFNIKDDVLPQLITACGPDVALPTKEELIYMYIFQGDNSFSSEGIFWSSDILYFYYYYLRFSLTFNWIIDDPDMYQIINGHAGFQNTHWGPDAYYGNARAVKPIML